MMITATPEGAAGISRFGRQHAKAAVLTVVGLAVLFQARSMPWVAVRPGRDSLARLLGQPPSTEVRTYVLTDLAGYWQPLYVGWASLVVLLVLAWVHPPWRFGVRLGAMLLGVVLGVGTLLPGTAAIDVSGFPSKDPPSADLLGGVWLAFFGVALLVRAVSALPVPSTAAAREAAPAVPEAARDAAPAAPAVQQAAPAVPEAASAVPLDEPAAADPAAAEDSAPFVWQGSRRKARPAAPWWRRPAPIAGVLAALAVVALLGTVTWYAIHSVGDDLGALVVVAPAGSAPAAPAAVDDQVDLGLILPIAPVQAFLLGVQVRDDVLHTAGSAWTRPDDTSVSITLLQFSSVGSANQFQRSYADLLRATPGELTPLADVAGAAVFVGAEPAGVWAVAGRDEVVVIVSAVGGPSNTVPAVEALVREQYVRL
ncbi:hypothetical protein [Micromonospora sp. LH3U1]|uniref:hypothetical protein n=1 Tax=Micromonospora sp. LH3U1 TaxID=3018339 RepID=UPI002349285D|nr:hypothetical protein [Micromonospora sp. LH3U1]WCN81328.1 hypothetical protein PCA76_31415 [Micromonospora sp. LH3U1]